MQTIYHVTRIGQIGHFNQRNRQDPRIALALILQALRSDLTTH